ncbi:Ubiquitin carboxyl-terminal hydrolase 6 [Chionoecetes opilio]|uniref:Ubiquitin carboxyl-terminal hydrolase 6 n=1 Tax=Chionoecetes opilio TaxID=41210 RepID=A0A8J4Y8H8_CHIOP|nr:Ubiquitin carboxyl-terminal hydrolase 6 [Chionoecetes opilio]
MVALRRERDRYKEDAQRFKRQEEATLKGSNEAKRIVEVAAPPPQLPQRESVAGEIGVDVDLAEVCGLPNLGNTCYINSVVQCLYHLPALRTCLAHCLREYTLNPKQAVNEASESKGAVAVALAEMFMAMQLNKGTHKAMGSLKRVFGSLDEIFLGTAQ